MSWPSWTDIFWPSWALTAITLFGVVAALRTLSAIKEQVGEMRNVGRQTEELIAESAAQSKSMERSVVEAAKLTAAMEKVAQDISISAKAATDSVSALRERTAQQMRAYLTVLIGGGIYQEREKNLKFEGKPNIINTGHTPAHRVRHKVKSSILAVPLPQDFAFPLPQEFTGGSVMGPQQTAMISAIVDDFIDERDVAAVKNGTGNRALYVWGIISYEDVFAESHYTRFCQIVTWLPDGKIFGYYLDRHNDAT